MHPAHVPDFAYDLLSFESIFLKLQNPSVQKDKEKEKE